MPQYALSPGAANYNGTSQVEFRGEFLGFQWDDIHSSELNIVRTINNQYFEDLLTPTISLTTETIPGSDGLYYFGQWFEKKEFSITIGFNSLTEQNLRQLIEMFSDKNYHDLTFDERPYKTYRVYTSTQPKFNYIGEDDDEYGIIYKGEGIISLAMAIPFATARSKVLNDYYGTSSTTIDDNGVKLLNWAPASGILDSATRTSQQLDIQQTITGNAVVKVYNPGLLKSNTVITITNYPSNNFSITYSEGNSYPGDQKQIIIIDGSQLSGTTLVLNSRFKTLAVDNVAQIYAITAGDFITIPPSTSGITKNYYVSCSNSSVTMTIDYDYVYI